MFSKFVFLLAVYTVLDIKMFLGSAQSQKNVLVFLLLAVQINPYNCPYNMFGGFWSHYQTCIIKC